MPSDRRPAGPRIDGSLGCAAPGREQGCSFWQVHEHFICMCIEILYVSCVCMCVYKTARL